MFLLFYTSFITYYTYTRRQTLQDFITKGKNVLEYDKRLYLDIWIFITKSSQSIVHFCIFITLFHE